jgi:outer membrane lipoprotein-sorting protein
MFSGYPRLFLAAFGLAFTPVTSLASQNRYDILAQVLRPYVSLFYSKSPTKAAQTQVVIRSFETRNGPIASPLLNQPILIAFEWPDKLRLEVTAPDQRIIVCRNAQQVWVYPRELGAELFATASNAEKGARVPDFRLPLHDQEILLLPALFRVVHLNNVTDSRGFPAWDLGFRTDPVLERELEVPQIIVSVLVRQRDYSVEHLKIRSGLWSGEMDIYNVQFAARLPAETWVPDAQVSPNVVALPPSLFRAALRRVSNLNLW